MERLKTYGKPRILIRPYKFKGYIVLSKKLNIVASLLIVGFYPIPLALFINKAILDKINLRYNIRW